MTVLQLVPLGLCHHAEDLRDGDEPGGLGFVGPYLGEVRGFSIGPADVTTRFLVVADADVDLPLGLVEGLLDGDVGCVGGDEGEGFHWWIGELVNW